MSDSFGDEVKRLRMQHNWTQNELSKISGISQPQISNIEGGNRKGTDGDSVNRLCVAFNLPLDYFVPWISPGLSVPPPPGNSVLEPLDISAFPPVRVVGVVGAGPAQFEHLSDEWVPAFERYTGTVVACRIKGDSLKQDGIENGDVVYVRQEPEPVPGDKVVAWVDSLHGHLAKVLRGRVKQYLVLEDGTKYYLTDNDRVYGAIVGIYREMIVKKEKL